MGHGSWAETVTSARPILHRYLVSRLPRRAHAHLADDLLQEVCLRALSAGRPHLKGNDLQYLLGIAHHLIADHYRRVHRDLLVEDPYVAGVGNEPTGSIEDIWALGDLTDSVRKALAGASELERELFDRLVILQESQATAAEALGLTRRQLRILLVRLRSILRHTLHRDHSAPGGGRKSTAPKRKPGPNGALGTTTRSGAQVTPL